MTSWRGSVIAAAWLACALYVWLGAPRREVRAESTVVTWRGQIAPVVFRNCTGCHHAGGSGPFDLTTYVGAKRWGPQMANVVASRYMPPWLPEPTSVHFEGDRRLKASEIELLTAWVKAGMPEGSGPEPRAPVYSVGWEMGPPDLVLEMPKAVTMPASGSDLFVNFILPAGVNKTQWVRAMEIQPGAGQLVHHANVILDRTESLRSQHPADWQGGVPGMDLQVDSGDAFDPDSHFLFWKPDSTALVEPPGMPWRLDPGDDLILNMHLKPTGKPEQVQARIGLYFTPTPATAHPMLLQLEHDSALDIPAGDADFVVTDELKLPVAVDVLGVYPHAHYLCREMEGWAALPDGRKQTIVLISNWDIDRQSVYRLERPLPLPAGTVLHMRYVYDNSAANVHNPNSPPVRVSAGNRATDEMSHLWLQVLPHASGAGDPRYPLEQAWMENVLRKSPTDPIALYNLGALMLMEGQAQQAKTLYGRLLTERPQDTRAMTSLGSAMQAMGDEDGARAEYEAVLALDPNQADAAFDLATLDLSTGQSAAAEPLFRRVAEQRPEDDAAADGLGQALMEQGRSSEAEPVFGRVLAKDPRNFAALLGVARIEMARNQVDAAEANLLQALAVRDDAEARRLLAMAYASEGDATKALDELRAWTKLAPAQPEPHRAMAQVLSASGRTDEALAEQHVVLRLSPADANDWNDLGAMEANAAHTAQARSAFEHALQLDPGNQTAQSNLRKLSSPN